MNDIYFEVIEKLYSAALDPELWDDALTIFSHAAGGFGAVLLSLDQCAPTSLSTGSLQEPNAAYAKEGWFRHDSLRRRGAELRNPNGVFTDRQLVAEDERRQDPFINEFWPKYRIGGMASYTLATGKSTFVLSVQRHANSEPFSQTQLDSLRLLGPHAQRALKLANKIARAEERASHAQAILERINAPCMIVETGCRVVAINSRAVSLLGTGVDVRKGRLVAMTSKAQNSLERLVHDASVHRSTNCLVLSAPEASNLVVQAFPLPQTGCSDPLHALRACGPVLLIIVSDQIERPSATTAVLRSMGLTHTEAAIAVAIGSGETPKEVAERLKISVYTIRAHLKAVFSKLGLRRQADLAYLLARLNIAG